MKPLEWIRLIALIAILIFAVTTSLSLVKEMVTNQGPTLGDVAHGIARGAGSLAKSFKEGMESDRQKEK